MYTLKQYYMILERMQIFCSCFQANNIQAIKHDFEKVKFLL